ncbi:hypothetical protein QZM52_25055 [Burkholderia metallica]|uniref:Uncharacterized protein n=1 Tax=Burkholderia metallica TaxID=488729 RepID=A0ABT8PHL1_9BURK|nr:hypothetical protein [Burkholderia metallica]MDN7934561.1 hypothetical protein [Burkholderia metallica]
MNDLSDKGASSSLKAWAKHHRPEEEPTNASISSEIGREPNTTRVILASCVTRIA